MFKGKTIIQRISKDGYILKSTLHFENENIKVTVKPGLFTNGASIPHMFWSVIGYPLNPKYIGSAIIHDGLYNSHIVSQKEADNLFRDMLEHNGVSIIKRNAMFRALRMFGFISYNRKTEEVQKETLKYITVKYK